jgi:L-threonylcarbamoyladenylate synthase
VAQVVCIDPMAPVRALADAMLLAASTMAAHGLVVAPTDTCYGLMVSPTSQQAIERLYRLKRRPRDKPVALLLARRQDLWRWGCATPLARDLARRLLPGPLTLLLASCGRLPEALEGPGHTVGVRVPNNPLTRVLCALAPPGIAATSANRAGLAAPATADEARAGWSAEPNLVILDAGPLVPSGESTVVDARGGKPVVLREGMLSLSDLTW